MKPRNTIHEAKEYYSLKASQYLHALRLYRKIHFHLGEILFV